MRKTVLFLVLAFIVGYSASSQSLPANTCGVVYTYDAAGNRTQRTYVCNNGPTSMASASSNLKSLDLKNVQKVDRLYPNPTRGTFTVTFTKPLEKAQIVLVDMSGRIVQQSVKSGNEVNFDISSQPSGMYLLRIQDGANTITQKVVKL